MSAWKQVAMTVVGACIVSLLGFAVHLAMSNTDAIIRNQEMIGTNSDRLSTIKTDLRYDEVVEELRSIKQILNEKM